MLKRYCQQRNKHLVVHNIYTEIRKYIKYLNIKKVRHCNSLFQTKTKKIQQQQQHETTYFTVHSCWNPSLSTAWAYTYNSVVPMIVIVGVM